MERLAVEQKVAFILVELLLWASAIFSRRPQPVLKKGSLNKRLTYLITLIFELPIHRPSIITTAGQR